MSVAIIIPQPPKPPVKFEEKVVPFHLDNAGPDPELKKILPMLFTSVESDAELPAKDGSVLFASLPIQASTGKTLPIAETDLRGVSTFFSRSHPGVDYRAGLGAPVLSAMPGTVTDVGFETGGYGRYIILSHTGDGHTYTSLYAHLKKVHVITGETVSVGQQIGEVGLTGHTSGPHLHFEIHDEQTAIDPMKFFGSGYLALAE